MKYKYSSPKLEAAQALLTGVLSPLVFDTILSSFKDKIRDTLVPHYYDLLLKQKIVPFITNNGLRKRENDHPTFFTPQILDGKYWGIKIFPPMGRFDFMEAATDFGLALCYPFNSYLTTPRPLAEARSSLFGISVVDHFVRPADLDLYLSEF